MIEQFEAVSYKGLQNFCVGPLQRVNLITGPNGVGKTSLAEALWLFHGRYNPLLLWHPHVQRRRIGTQSPLKGLGGSVHLRGRENDQLHSVDFEYSDLQGADTIEVRQTLGTDLPSSAPSNSPEINVLPVMGRLRVVYDGPSKVVHQSDVLLSATGPALATPIERPVRSGAAIVTRYAPFPVSEDTIERFSNVVAAGDKQGLLDILHLLHPRIRGLEILTNQGVPSLWADTEAAGMLPLEAVGGGVVRLLGLLVNFFTAEGGLIVIDEIENGIHHSALPELWRQILQLSELLDVQVVATTYSFESIYEAVTTGEDGQAPRDFVVHRMYANDGVPRSHTYAGEKLMTALELGFDVR